MAKCSPLQHWNESPVTAAFVPPGLLLLKSRLSCWTGAPESTRMLGREGGRRKKTMVGVGSCHASGMSGEGVGV